MPSTWQLARVKVKEPCRYIEQSIFGLEPTDGVRKVVCHPDVSSCKIQQTLLIWTACRRVQRKSCNRYSK